MDDVGNDDVRLLDHPLVPVVDRKALCHGLDAFGQDSGGMASK